MVLRAPISLRQCTKDVSGAQPSTDSGDGPPIPGIRTSTSCASRSVAKSPTAPPCLTSGRSAPQYVVHRGLSPGLGACAGLGGRVRAAQSARTRPDQLEPTSYYGVVLI